PEKVARYIAARLVNRKLLTQVAACVGFAITYKQGGSMMVPRWRAVATGLWLIAVPSSPFAQDSVANFYQGKTIRFVIGANAGGGNDSDSRLVCRYLGTHMPGKPAVLPVNMPGASGHISAAHIFTVAPKDGTSIGA